METLLGRLFCLVSNTPKLDHIRKGQHLFNCLAQLNNNLANHVADVGPGLDPFYNDSNIPNFLRFVESYDR